MSAGDRFTEPEREVRYAPTNELEGVAAAGMAVIAQLLEAAGEPAARVVVLVQVEHQLRPGELNAATTAHNVDGVGDVIGMLLEHAQVCGQAIGLTVNVEAPGA